MQVVIELQNIFFVVTERQWTYWLGNKCGLQPCCCLRGRTEGWMERKVPVLLKTWNGVIGCCPYNDNVGSLEPSPMWSQVQLKASGWPFIKTWELQRKSMSYAPSLHSVLPTLWTCISSNLKKSIESNLGYCVCIHVCGADNWPRASYMLNKCCTKLQCLLNFEYSWYFDPESHGN